MTMKSDKKYGEESTFSFQNWHEKFDQFLSWVLKSIKKFHFNWLLLSKAYIFWAKKVQQSYVW